MKTLKEDKGCKVIQFPQQRRGKITMTVAEFMAERLPGDKREWITVNDALPGKELVLLKFADNRIEMGLYKNNVGMGSTNGLNTESLNPTHWMPLPKPPKE